MEDPVHAQPSPGNRLRPSPTAAPQQPVTRTPAARDPATAERPADATEVTPRTTPPQETSPPDQPPPATEGAPSPDVDEPLQQLALDELSALEEEALTAAGEDQELRQRLTELYQSARTQLQLRDQLVIRANQYIQASESVTSRVEEIQRLFAEAADAKPRAAAAETIAELELELRQREESVSKLKKELSDLEASIASRSNRRAENRQAVAKQEQELARLKSELALPPTEGESPLLNRARQLEMLARRLALEAEMPMLQAEMALMNARDAVTLDVLEQDLKTRLLATATEEAQATHQALAPPPHPAAAHNVSQAKQAENAAQHPVLRKLAEENRQYAETYQQLAQKIAAAQAEKLRVATQLEQLKTWFRQSREKEQLVGLSASVGAMLRNHRLDFPKIRLLRDQLRQRQEQIDSVNLEIYELNEQRSLLANVEPHARQIIESLPADQIGGGTERQQLLDGAIQLLRQRKEILVPLTQSQNALFDAMTETSIDQQQLINLTEDFSDYIDQRVLWIRSAAPITLDLSADEALRWTSPRRWQSIGNVLWRDLRTYWPLYAAAVGILTLLTVGSLRAHHALALIAEEARKSTCRRFLPTFRAFMITLVMALRNVIPLAFVAWRLRLITPDESCVAFASALSVAAKVAFPLEFFRQVARREGLADAHFSWSPQVIDVLRRHLRWLSPVATVLVGFASLLAGDDGASGPTNVERLVFVFAAGCACIFGYRLLHPKMGIPAQYLVQSPDSWLARLQPVWFSIVFFGPFGIAVLSALGYVYTANQLAWRVFATVVALASLFTLFGLIARALLVYRRAACIDQARQRYQAARAAEEAAGGEAPPSIEAVLSEMAPVEDPLADLRSQTLQARRLTAAVMFATAILVMWLIWSDVLPALDFFERWPIWNSTKVTTELVELDTGAVERRTREVVDPVTMVELAGAIFIFVLSLVAARDVPGMAEITVLNRLPLDKSVRYAITTLVSYAIVLAGLVFSCQYIGLRWSQIQWMATALTFGLAFGLQEMFANFVAGIIILFERPVRVGDIVTLEDVTGVVSRVQIRATTITNWDRKDYIVPNKDFITGRVLNWTLSDSVNRIVVNVGVAYGTDTQLAKQLICSIAKNHPVIVDDPGPMTTFEEFGESSLNFVLRCYISMHDMPMRLQVIDDLHTSIDSEFRKAGIEIAFPQRDLHIRSTPPGHIGTGFANGLATRPDDKESQQPGSD